MAISMLKIRRLLGRLIFNMGIAIPGKTVFLIETAPWWLRSLMAAQLIAIMRCSSYWGEDKGSSEQSNWTHCKCIYPRNLEKRSECSETVVEQLHYGKNNIESSWPCDARSQAAADYVPRPTLIMDNAVSGMGAGQDSKYMYSAMLL